MALWQVLDYTSATLRVAVKHPPNNSLKLDQKDQLKAERLNARLILLFAVQIDLYAEIFVRKE